MYKTVLRLKSVFSGTLTYLQEHYVALAGSLDREADARLEQEPGVESKTKKLTRYVGNLVGWLLELWLGPSSFLHRAKHYLAVKIGCLEKREIKRKMQCQRQNSKS